MIDIIALLKELNNCSITLSIENGKLSVDAPDGTITPELLDSIKLHKSSLINIISLSPASLKLQDIAIIGISCKAAGADNKEVFWDNLINGVESIRDISDQELLLSGVDPKDIADSNYVKRGAFINNLEEFDAHFFGYSPLDAKSLDPQQRHFFECSWEALEDAGVCLKRYIGKVGVFAGRGYNNYLHSNVLNSNIIDTLGAFQIQINNAYLSTRLSYHFNLAGPSYDISTACSTSLVAVHDAIRSLLFGESDIALSGGVTLSQISGYLYQEGMISSPEGRCRTFDADAGGTIFGSAIGVIVLKRLDDAIADNDQIYALIKSTAINNDGSKKVSFTAPSVVGQSNVIRDAIDKSGVDPETISYIEAHGTATPLGDPIEISALTQAYRNFTDKKQYCAIGSVKTNIGHTDTAAGVMGLIKTALSLKNKKIPASLHFNKPNPEIDFENSPFFVNSKLRNWDVPDGVPRRAGVSSFGIGGTNAHAILEEAPEREASSKSRKQQLLLLSAKTDTSVSAYAGKLADFLKENKKEIKLADVAYTLQVGRDSIKYRRYYVANSAKQAVEVLGKKATKQQKGELLQEGVMPEIVFMFSGQGAQYANMARGLYEQEPIFKITIDECCDILKSTAKLDLLPVLYPKKKTDIKTATDKITETNYAQPALFVVEYALAKLLMHWGIKPKTTIGHSIGEYIAATLAGVFNLKDALVLVAMRGQLMRKMKPGSMLSVNLAEGKLKKLLPQDIALAAVNAPNLCVVSGETKTIKVFQDELEKKDIACSLLYTSHAFHSPMMQGAADEFLKALKKIKKSAPKIGFISNLTGKMITKDQAMSDQYWVDHLLSAVLFDKGISQLLTDKLSCLVEIGPGRSLSTFALQNKSKSKSHHVLTSVRHPKDEMDDLAMLLSLVGRLWLAGVEIDYAAFYENERRNKISIPTYCFDHKRYWIEPEEKALTPATQEALLAKNPDITKWFYEPSWENKRLLLNENNLPIETGSVLILGDSLGLSDKLIQYLSENDFSVIKVLPGKTFEKIDKQHFVIDPNNSDDYGTLADDLKKQDIDLKLIIHAWQFTDKFEANLTIENVEADLDIGYYSLLSLMQSLFSHGFTNKMSFKVLSNHVSNVLEGELTLPQKGMIQALVQVIPQEYPQIRCQHIDVTGINLDDDLIFNNVCDELTSDSLERIVAYRGKQRWVKKYTQLALPKQNPEPVLLKDKGVYLITGGLGNVGLLMANYIAKRVKANIILMGRSEFPAEGIWNRYIKEKKDDASDIVALKIRRLQEIKALGSEVKIVQADVSNQDQMTEVLSNLKQEYGEINGVVHSAGALNEDLFLPVTETDKNNCELHFQPKVQGTLSLSNSLNEVLKYKPLDFCILMSSLSAVLGGLNFVAYSAANYFLDHFAQFNTDSPNNFISIDWDGWLPIGMDDSTKDARGWEYVISSFEGDQLFNYVLSLMSASLHQCVVATGDLESRMARTDLSALYGAEQEEVLEVEDASDIKETVSNIWKEILGVDEIDDDDDFFELGGHSLLAAQLVARIHAKLNCDIPIKAIFEKPKLMDLALFIENKLKEGKGDAYTSIKRVKRLKGGHAMSFAQERLWFLDQFEGSNENYNIPIIVRLTGKLNIHALQQSCNQLMARQDSFRTIFVKNKQGKGRQKVLEIFLIDLKVEQLTSKALKQAIREEVHTPFDLEKGPLIRVRLFETMQEQFILVINHHHIISDGWSINIIAKELSELYGAAVDKREPELDPLPIQYVDFTAWQRAEFKKPAFQDKLTFWKDYLADYEDLPLPIDKLRPASFSYQGADVPFSLDKDLSGQLAQLAKDHGTTLYIVLLMAFNILMSRYSGQEDVIIGSPIANRYHHGIEDLVGFFVNTLVLRNQIDGDKSIHELLAEISTNALNAFEHQEVPFEQLVEILGVARDPSRNPIIQVMFSLQSFGADTSGDITLNFPGIDVKSLTEDSFDIAKFDLSLFMSESSDGLVGSINYCTDLFHQDSIDRMARNFERLLAAIVEDSAKKVKDLRLLTDERRQQILVDWNNTAAPYPKDKTIYQLFEEQVEKTPSNTAVVFEDQELTYTELNARANQLACLIRTKYKQQNKKDLKPDSLIGLCVERSLDMIISILGILKAGAAYVPLDPDYPQDRLEYMIKDSHEGLIITQKSVVERDGFLDKLHHDELLVIDSDQVKVDLKKQSNANLKAISGPSDLAYVIYTSGSTARPKGVMIEHKSVINVISDFSQLLAVATGKCFLSLSSMNFDIFVLEYTLPLFNGCQCVIASESTKRDMVLLENLFNRHRPDFAQGTPSLWNVLAAQLPELNNPLTILTGGEKLSNGLKDKLIKIAPEVYNVYGPTEATIWSTHERCQKDKRVSIGKPLSNTRCFVLDVNNNPSPIGTPGELYIGGAGLARGYLNQKELTNERFIPNPFAEELGLSKTDRIYKTGDLVRWLPDGNIEYLGRTDFQVKIRGFRIELGEIENTLGKHKSISQVCVVALDKDNQKYLAAYYVLAQGKPEPGIDELRAYLSETLPDYMVPAAFVKLDEMPLTPNGKVNRKALPDPDMSLMGEDYVAPRNDVEQKLAAIWCDVLKIKQVGMNNNFFHLGGNSLLAIQLTSRVNQLFGFSITVAWCFSHRTISEQAHSIIDDSKILREYQHILKIKSRNGQVPLFFVHPAIAGAEVYLDMGYMFRDQIKLIGNIYGIESYNLNHLDNPITDIPSLAEKYIEFIKVIQPHGPYFLVGWSMGGNIAYEMAQQLHAKGELVPSVYLIDSNTLDVKKDYELGLQDEINRLRTKLDALMSADDYDRLLLMKELGAPADYIEKASKLVLIAQQLSSSYSTNRLAAGVEIVLMKALYARTDGSESIEMQGVRKKLFSLTKYAQNGWSEYVQDLTVHELNADHGSIVLERKFRKRMVKIIEEDMNRKIKSLGLEKKHRNNDSDDKD